MKVQTSIAMIINVYELKLIQQNKWKITLANRASHISAIERELSNEIKIESQLNFLHPSHSRATHINSTDFNGSFPSAERNECASIDIRQVIEWAIKKSIRLITWELCIIFRFTFIWFARKFYIRLVVIEINKIVST